MSQTKSATLAEVLAHAEAKQTRDRDAERHAKRDLYAGLLGLRLRQEGLSVEKAAEAVIAAYPHTAARLQPLIEGSADEKRDQFGRLVGHAQKAKAAGA
jgi:hypothetical protein